MLRLLKVPPKPHLPAGATDSARVFRASKRYLQLKLLNWGGGQVLTFIGLVAALIGLHFIGTGSIEVLSNVPHRPIILRVLGWFEIIGVLGFLVQLPLSLVPVILDWEMRWYIVTDRSLRIREGVWKVSEMTLTFANVQEVSIRQGPLERLFGIANLRVRTAGGGGRINPHEPQSEEKSGHIGYFRGVDNAPAIRDLILERLKRLRDAGLGDPDQRPSELELVDTDGSPAILDAARELLTEARALRRAVVR
ncbi:MAG: PH domain-containing protein [Acidobacteria bacterium]|nr:PH domain-containing protein [Candidatus Sulfomarinibacter kjeldsenii]